MTASNVETVRAIYKSWSEGDFRGFRDLFAADVVYTTFTAEGDTLTVHGLDAMVEWHGTFFRQWKNFRIWADDIVDCGDRVLVIGHQAAEGRLSGVRAEMEVFGVWTFRDGQVTAFTSTRHREAAHAEAGLPPD